MGQEGVNVSGGQKQRICIARAILKKPKVLILDDSTSAVDTATEGKIRNALAKKLPDMTKIIIAQRISSVCHADQIIIMDGGRVDAIGTHESLLRTNKIYQEIYESQKEGADLLSMLDIKDQRTLKRLLSISLHIWVITNGHSCL